MWIGLVTRVIDEDFGSSVTISGHTFQSSSKSFIEGEVYEVETDGAHIVSFKHTPFEIIEGRLHQLKIFGETCHFYVGDRHLIAMNENYQNGNYYKFWVVGKTVYKSIKKVI